MLEYVFPHNIDTRVLKKADHILQNNGLVAFPTDSSWSIACAIESKEGIEKLRQLKGGLKDYTISVLCRTIRQIEEIAKLENSHFKTIKSHVPGPFVFILPAKKKIEKHINMKRVEIGIRIPDHPVPMQLLKIHDSPIFVITASKEMTNKEWWDDAFATENLFENGWELEDIPGVELIIDTGDVQPRQLSTVIDMRRQELSLLRQGVGEFNH